MDIFLYEKYIINKDGHHHGSYSKDQLFVFPRFLLTGTWSLSHTYNPEASVNNTGPCLLVPPHPGCQPLTSRFSPLDIRGLVMLLYFFQKHIIPWYTMGTPVTKVPNSHRISLTVQHLPPFVPLKVSSTINAEFQPKAGFLFFHNVT